MGIVLFKLALNLTQSEMGSNASLHFRQLKGFGDVVHTTRVEGFDLVHRLVESADEQDRDFLQDRVGLDLSAGFVAIQIRHLDVQQDQVRRVEPGRLQFATASPQHVHQDLQIGDRIIGNQDVRPYKTIGSHSI
jgi:hypothetical protein